MTKYKTNINIKKNCSFFLHPHKVIRITNVKQCCGSGSGSTQFGKIRIRIRIWNHIMKPGNQNIILFKKNKSLFCLMVLCIDKITLEVQNKHKEHNVMGTRKSINTNNEYFLLLNQVVLYILSNWCSLFIVIAYSV